MIPRESFRHSLAPNTRGKLISLATETERTLFFDFLPLSLGEIRGFKTKFQLYTVPGQVIYNTTRQLVLRGVDGIVFVADSQYDKMEENVKSFQNLEDNLKGLNLNLSDIPYVLQYNKRDMPNVAPIEFMEYLLNNRAEQAQIAESLAFAYSQQKNFAKTTEYAQRAKQLGGGSPQLNQLLDYVRAQSGDYSTIARDAAAAVAAAEKDGKKPTEDDLLRLADAYKRMDNKPGYASALEKLVTFYPKKDYWSAHLVNVQRKPGFSDRLGLDLMRLRLRHGILSTADEYMEMAQLALQAGLPAEAKDIMAKGYAAGVLGTGDQAERHKRLSDLVAKTEADVNGNLDKLVAEATTQRDGNDLVKAGMVYASRGDGPKAAELIEKGIAKGNLKRPDDAKLRLGLAQLMTPALKAKGTQTLRAIDAKDGTADVARLWLIGG